MEQYSEVFIGLDTSKLKISVAVADGERAGEVRFFGDISSEPGAAEFQGDENCAKISADRGRLYGVFNRSLHGCLQSKWCDSPIWPIAAAGIHLPWDLQSDTGYGLSDRLSHDDISS